MTDLKCTVENCTYNKERLCSKGDIMVGGRHACCENETCCESFLPRKGASNSYTNCTCHPTSNISIDCEAAKCTYNKNYKCTAAPATARRPSAPHSGNPDLSDMYNDWDGGIYPDGYVPPFCAEPGGIRKWKYVIIKNCIIICSVLY